MRQYQLKETKEIKKIICNKCGMEIQVVNGCPGRGYSVWIRHGGTSRRRDGEHHSFDLCESCYDELLKSFLIPAEIEE